MSKAKNTKAKNTPNLRANNPWSNDHYTQRAKREGYAARSVYKLEWLHKRHTLLRKGMRVLDLGCAPGAWTRYIQQKIGQKGMVLGIDQQSKPANWQGWPYWQLNVLEAPLEDVCAVLLGQKTPGQTSRDAHETSFQAESTGLLVKPRIEQVPVKVPLNPLFYWKHQRVGAFDLLCSDMAPRTTGTPSADAAKSHQLTLSVLAWAKPLLKKGGSMVVKVFQGAGIAHVRQDMNAMFDKVYAQRPPATRSASVEAFFVGLSKR